jgi:hypothetical protein
MSRHHVLVIIAILVIALLQMSLQMSRLQNWQETAPTTLTHVSQTPPLRVVPEPLVPDPVPNISTAYSVLSQNQTQTLLPLPTDADADASRSPPPSIPFSGNTPRKISTTAAIVTLTANKTKDMERLCTALHSLKFLPDARNHSRPLASVLIFHENNIPHPTLANLQNCTPRPLSFPSVDDYFDSYPPGFDPVKEPSPWRRRTKFGYAQMIRFYVTGLWKHPAIQGYESVMRLDNDATWDRNTLQNETFPDLPMDKVYHANVLSSDPPEYCSGIWWVARNYIATHNISVANPQMWKIFSRHFHEGGDRRCLMWYNNFEVVRVPFMQQPQVQHWHETVTEHEPFGVYRRRWGDNIIRFLTMTIFAEPGTLLATGAAPAGYQHKGVSI